MARSDHANLNGPDRFERAAARRRRPQPRRTGTRRAQFARALQEA